jgi:hypothetical protein
MRVERFLNLAQWGYNVPVFVYNPVRNYGNRDAYISLRTQFTKVKPFDLLASRIDGKETKFFEDLSLADAVLRMAHLEDSNYETILMERYKIDWEALLVCARGGGKMYIYGLKDSYEKIIEFHELREIEDLTLRHVVRSCQGIGAKFPDKMVRVDLKWAKDFVGVNPSKLILYDYRYV